MPLSITRNYDTGVALTEAHLDAICDSVETYINVTGLGADNIQDGSIGAAELSSSAVTEAKLASSSVATAKIQDNAVTMAKLATALQAYLVPTGSVVPYGGDSAPSGFLLCDGTAVNRTTYATLFALVGVRFGSGDGTTTFNVPDLRGRFIRGLDGGSGLDPDAATRTAMNSGGATGNNVGSVQGDAYHNHNHGVSQTNVQAGSQTVVTAVNSASDLGSGTQETRPKNAALNFLIKT